GLGVSVRRFASSRWRARRNQNKPDHGEDEDSLAELPNIVCDEVFTWARCVLKNDQRRSDRHLPIRGTCRQNKGLFCEPGQDKDCGLGEVVIPMLRSQTFAGSGSTSSHATRIC